MSFNWCTFVHFTDSNTFTEGKDLNTSSRTKTVVLRCSIQCEALLHSFSLADAEMAFNRLMQRGK